MKTHGSDFIYSPSMATGPDGYVYDLTSAFGYTPLTKREYFAVMAMQGFCLQATGAYEKGPCNAAIVKRAVLLADMLIVELNKEPEHE